MNKGGWYMSTDNRRYIKYKFDNIVGESEAILKVKAIGMKASKTTSPVLIYGETGTGKELFVQAIHNESNRINKPFIAQNCAAIPQNLLESMFFGTMKGGFTGAENSKGLFEMADGGTLYLDELNSMPLEFQGKLLRVLQEGVITKVGDTSIKKVDVRIIASLNEEPELLVQNKALRKDLYYRINVVRIDLPSLRERKEDIPMLVNFFIEKFNKIFNADIIGVDNAVLEELILYSWEGNVRQLEHIIEAAFNLKQKGILTKREFNINDAKLSNKRKSLKEKLEAAERIYIKESLVINDNNVSKAAKYLNIPRQTLQYKIKRLNII